MRKSSGLVFPYGITLKENGEFDTFPVATVSFPYRKNEWLSFFLIIDSGATISALPKSDAAVLGIYPESGNPISISGINNQLITGWMHKMNVRLGTQIIKVPIAFLDSESSPRILGRAGIFDRFTIIFEEAKRRSGLILKNSSEAQHIRKILASY